MPSDYCDGRQELIYIRKLRRAAFRASPPENTWKIPFPFCSLNVEALLRGEISMYQNSEKFGIEGKKGKSSRKLGGEAFGLSSVASSSKF